MVEFNWVKAQCDCSPEIAFAQLKLGVEADVATIQDTAATKNWRTSFSIKTSGNRFGVLRERIGGVETVSFVLEKRGILVTLGNGESFQAVPAMNPEGDCMLLVGGDQMDFWQVRRKALSDLFFSN